MVIRSITAVKFTVIYLYRVIFSTAYQSYVDTDTKTPVTSVQSVSTRGNITSGHRTSGRCRSFYCKLYSGHFPDIRGPEVIVFSRSYNEILCSGTRDPEVKASRSYIFPKLNYFPEVLYTGSLVKWVRE